MGIVSSSARQPLHLLGMSGRLLAASPDALVSARIISPHDTYDLNQFSLGLLIVRFVQVPSMISIPMSLLGMAGACCLFGPPKVQEQ